MNKTVNTIADRVTQAAEIIKSTNYTLRELKFDKKPLAKPGFGVKTNTNRTAKLLATQFSLEPRLLPAKAFSFPYHFHRHAEELFIVLKGTMTLRTPRGFQKLKQGDVVFFEKGPAGAHQLYNHSRQPCVYLDLAIQPGADVVEYPDSGKLLIAPEGGIYRKDSAVGYFDGEENPWAHWLAAHKTKKGKKC